MKKNKHINLLSLIRASVTAGSYLDTYHAQQRGDQRAINKLEIEFVLKMGWHERTKDKYDEIHKAWNYSIRGKTLDNKDLRIVVSFENLRMIIITVMEVA